MGFKFLSAALLSLFVTQNIWAAAMPAFTTFGSGFTPKKETEIVITNMPKVMSQDTLGICYSFAAAAVMQANNCRIQRQDCPNLSEADTFSPLDVARFGQNLTVKILTNLAIKEFMMVAPLASPLKWQPFLSEAPLPKPACR